jgi:apolipoprotein D and lipocalin family protein
VLSRRPVLAAGDYAEAVGIARAEGFEIGRLQITPQRGG